MIYLTLRSLIKLCTLWIIGVKSQSLTRLGHLNVNKEFVTVSGFSSGGTFAQQLYVSHSSLISGIAVFSHTYYRCGIGNGILRDYDAVCTTTGNLRNNELYDPNNAINDIHNYFHSGLIDDPSYMANKPFYIFSGTRNYLFTADMSLRILQVFEPFVSNPHSFKTRVAAANLTLPSNLPDLPACAAPTNSIQVSNCGFSGPLEALQFLLGKEAVTAPKQRSSKFQMQPLLPFDQSEFFYETDRNDMDSVGFVYVPKVCQSNRVQCLLHFYFHGCSTGREFVGPDHILNSGFLQVAEANGIIMIFPQAVSSPENTIGCWDTFGVTGSLHATKKGAQVTVVKNILDRVLGKEFSTYRRPYSESIPSAGPRPSSNPHSPSSTSYSFAPGHDYDQHRVSNFQMTRPNNGFVTDSMVIPLPVSEISENQHHRFLPNHFIKNMVIHQHGRSDDFGPITQNNFEAGTNKCNLAMGHPNTIFQRCFTN